MDDNLSLANYIMKNLKAIEQENQETENNKKMKAKQEQAQGAKFISRKKLAIRWEVSTMTIRRIEWAGMLKAYRFFRDVRYAIEDVEKVEKNALEKK